MRQKRTQERSGIEKREDMPELKFHFLFAPHSLEKDFKVLEDLMRQADIYVPEILGHSPAALTIYRSASEGKKSGNVDFGDEHNDAKQYEFEQIRKNRIHVEFVDLPQGHPLFDLNVDSMRETEMADRHFLNGRFDLAMIMTKSSMRKCADANKAREQYIKDQLQNNLPEIIKRIPKLSQKTTLKVLVNLGLAHTGVFNEMKGEENIKNVTTRTIEGKKPILFPRMAEYLRAVAAGKEIDYDDEYFARMLLENNLLYYFSIQNGDSALRGSFARSIANKFSYEEIKEFSENILKGRMESEYNRLFAEFVGSKLPEFKSFDDVYRFIKGEI